MWQFALQNQCGDEIISVVIPQRSEAGEPEVEPGDVLSLHFILKFNW